MRDGVVGNDWSRVQIWYSPVRRTVVFDNCYWQETAIRCVPVCPRTPENKTWEESK
jgi:hypothetical protein